MRIKNYAFILPNTIADYISRRKPCDIQMVPVSDPEMRWGYGLAVPRGSGLRDYLNSALLILEERGFIQSIYDKWWINRGTCAGIRSSRVVSGFSSAAGDAPWRRTRWGLGLWCACAGWSFARAVL